MKMMLAPDSEFRYSPSELLLDSCHQKAKQVKLHIRQYREQPQRKGSIMNIKNAIGSLQLCKKKADPIRMYTNNVG